MKLSTLSYALLPLAMSAPLAVMAQTSVVDEGQGAGTQNDAIAVNNASIVIGNALSATGTATAFVIPSQGDEIALPALANDDCSAGDINNNGSASQILGACKDANGVIQAVVWNNSTLTDAPLVLNPIGGLGNIGADVSATASAQNDEGAVVGTSSSSDDIGRPVYWAPGATTPNILYVGLLDLASTNCGPSDISNPIASNGGLAAIVGNCPNAGKSMPIIWMNPAASATQLPVPTDAEDCAAGEINGEGDVLGSCAYANGVYKTVRWSYPWTSTPIVLTSISGNANSHNGGVDMNDNGQIAGSYLGRDGFKHAFYWDPSTGTDAIDVPPLHGGYITTAVAIGNNGRVAGISETPGGLANAFHWLPGSSPVDDTPLPGGNNDAFVALSRDGTVAVGGSETAEHNEHAILEYLP